MSPFTLKSSLLVILIASYFCFLNGQDSLTISSSPGDFQMILLDGENAYLDPATKRIYTLSAYQALIKGKEKTNQATVSMDQDLDHGNTSFDEYWDTTKVNPYPKVNVTEPFQVLFDDLKYAQPVDGKMVITSRFGRRRRGPHRGIDIDLVTGDEVKSILPGKVRFVGYSRGHGRTVVVRHAHDLETVYAHLSSYDVKTNDVIEKGQVIGKGGTSGNARGSHLHMEIRHKGITINPEYLLDFKNEPQIRGEKLWVTKGIVNPLNFSSYHFSHIEVMQTKELAIEGQKKERRVHVVRKGDTLWGIARSNGMRVKDLVAMNRRVSSKSTLRIGQHLVISP